MTVVKEWAVGLCAAAFAMAIVRGLMPRGAASKGLSFVISAMFFCCLISPLRELGAWVSALSTLQPSTSVVSEEVEELAEKQLLSAMALTMTDEAARLVSDFGVTVRSVEPKRDIARDDGIYIASATVVVDKRDHPVDRRVYDVLEQKWGIPVEVWYGE
ncbi:MAG: hypothetical protein IKV35_02580 [Clostridia bacterium]|nr:hypothetical protein [Clostridia bacterium]